MVCVYAVIFSSCLLYFVAICSASEQLLDFQTCCQYCSSDQEAWTDIAGGWNLSISNQMLLDFRSPPAFLLDDSRLVTSELFGRDYAIMYGGAPVIITYNSLISAGQMLNKQYAEYDLLSTQYVTGITIQGGFVLDINEELFWRKEMWITKFIVSYSTIPGAAFRFITSGSIVLFEGNSSPADIVVRTFPVPVNARLIRIHPLGALGEDGEPTQRSMFRSTPIICSNDATCGSVRYNCQFNTWQIWGECLCDSVSICRQRRVRTVGRYEGCGGTGCAGSEEWRSCVLPTPQWQIIAIGVGVSLAILIILLIAIIIPVKKYLDSKQPEFVFQQDEKKKQKMKKDRTLRNDLAVNEKSGDLGADAAEEYDDFDENELNPEAGFMSTEVDDQTKKSKKQVTFDSKEDIRTIKDDTPSPISEASEEVPRMPDADATPRDVDTRATLDEPISSSLPPVRTVAELDDSDVEDFTTEGPPVDEKTPHGRDDNFGDLYDEFGL